VQRRPAQVSVDQHHAPTVLGQGDSQVGDGRRFALARARAGHADDLDLSVIAGELQVRGQGAIRLGHGRARIAPHRQSALRGNHRTAASILPGYAERGHVIHVHS
jgi:hypothetical protein